MEMSNRQIILEYITASCKSTQIKILAQLNDCDEEDIKRILIEGGIVLNRNAGRNHHAKRIV